MAAPIGGEKNIDEGSSSDSDAEEKGRLESSVWEFVSAPSSKSESLLPNVTSAAVPPSRREDRQDPFAESDDYRVAKTTPEYKSFVAKKLTAYLDRFIKDVDTDGDRWKSKVPDQSKEDASFRLFSTSSGSYKPPAVSYPQPAWKRKKKKSKEKDDNSSSTSSDSEEEQQRLQEAAVTGDFILEGSQGHRYGDHRDEEPHQVTSNPDSSLLTHNATHPEETHGKLKKKKKKRRRNVEGESNSTVDNSEEKRTKADDEDDSIVEKIKCGKERNGGSGHNGQSNVGETHILEATGLQSHVNDIRAKRTERDKDHDDYVKKKKKKKREIDNLSQNGHNSVSKSENVEVCSGLQSNSDASGIKRMTSDKAHEGCVKKKKKRKDRDLS